jgi:Cu-Zn family superoxide dismutase
MKGKTLEVEQFLRGITVEDLYGRSLIVHADPDDLGKGKEEDSKTTGHSGKRIACAIIGRTVTPCQGKTRKNKGNK